MEGSRFEAIFWNLHMSNVKEEDEQNDQLKGTTGYDVIYDMQGILLASPEPGHQ